MKIVTPCYFYRPLLAIVSVMVLLWVHAKGFVNKMFQPAKAIALLFALILLFLSQQSFAQTQTFTTSGNFTVPAGVHIGLNDGTSSIYSRSGPGEVSGQCSITTDKEDYYPGEWVIITGTGWQDDDSVQLTITHLDPLPVPNHIHFPWYVKPNADGNIYEKWYVQEQELGTSLKLEAFGINSEKYSVAYFTDAKIGFVSAVINGAPVTVCTGNTISLSLNVTTCSSGGNGNYNANYQWQQSADNATWSNATGTSTNSTYSASIVSNTYYRCQITITGTYQGCGITVGNFYTTSSALITIGPPTLILTSDPSTTNQTACIGSPIIPITYLVGGAGIGATGSGLPAGVTGSYNSTSQIYTISGTPTTSGTFNYSVTTTTSGSCSQASLTGTIFVTTAIYSGSIDAVRAGGGRCSILIFDDSNPPVGLCPDGSSPTYRWYRKSSVNGTYFLIADSTRKDLLPPPGDLNAYYYARSVVCGSCESVLAESKHRITFYMQVSVNAYSSSCAGANNGSVTATIQGGIAPFVYTLYLNGVQSAQSPITTNTTWTFNGLGPGSYYVNVGDQADQVGGPKCHNNSNTVVVAQNDVTQGTISASQSICSGTNATPLNGTASGSGTLSYQWQSSIDNGVSWPYLSGAMGATYTPTGLTTTTQFRRIVTSTLNGTPCSTLPSNAVTITVYPLPTITTAASAASVCFSTNSQTTTLDYSATTYAPINYSISWNSLPANSFAPVTNASLAVSPITINIPANTAAGTYTGNITVKNANGCASSAGIPFTFTVTPIVNVSAQPQNQTDCDGNSVVFGVTITGGTSPITYAWQRKLPAYASFTNISGDPDIKGILTNSMQVSNIGSANSPNLTQYQVVITDACGITTSSPATLKVNEITGLIPSPEIPSVTSVVIREGTSMTYTVQTSGEMPSSYQWLKNNVPLADGYNYSGVTSPTLTIPGAIPSQSGSYQVMVGFPITVPNNNGTDTCRRTSALIRGLTVNPKPVITAMTKVVCSGDGFKLIPVNGTNGLVPIETTYSWSAPSGTGFTGGVPGSGAANISGTLTNTTTAAVTATYTVTPTASNCLGNTFTVTVTLNPLPTTSAIYHQ